MRVLHFEQVGGASGDMLLGALVGLGVDAAELEAVLRSLGLPGLALEVTAVERNGAPATRVRVLVDGRPAEAGAPEDTHAREHHDHEHDHHDHGHHHPHDHHHHHPPHEHHHGHEHHHDHGRHHGHGHEHRRLADITRMVEAAPLPPEVRRAALAVFQRLAEAEAAVHGTSIDAVHFHEVGAIDSIADVVGSAWAIHRLGVERVTTGPFVLGRGEVVMAHGRWPVPAPATVRLVEGHPVRFVDLAGETVTPTGAAVLTTLAEPALELPALTLERTSAGAGGREWPDRPNVLRAFLGTARDAAAVPGTRRETIMVLATQVDDMTPQAVSDLAERLMGAGALDVTVTPTVMKKGRPAVELTIHARPGVEGNLAELLLNASTTLGVRIRSEERLVLPRQGATVETRWGPVRVKLARRPDGRVEAAPEFDDCQEISQQDGKSLHYVVEEVRRVAAEALAAGTMAFRGGSKSPD